MSNWQEEKCVNCKFCCKLKAAIGEYQCRKDPPQMVGGAIMSPHGQPGIMAQAQYPQFKENMTACAQFQVKAEMNVD